MFPFSSKLAAKGRGRHYTFKRALMERTLGALYGHDWPARLWSLVPGSVEVTLTRHSLAVLPPWAEPLRIGFASDLHLGPTTPDELLDSAFQQLAELDPDVLFLGGDYVFLDATEAHAKRLKQLIARVKTPAKYAVLGNHDLWTDHTVIERALTEAGCELLINECARMKGPHSKIAVIGLDEPWTGDADPSVALAACEAFGVETRLLLCHSPDGFLLVPKGIALYTAGHTHGGHLALPGGKAVVLPPGPGSRHWPRGLHAHGDGYVFVSRGLGATEVPVRSFSAPEIALITLTPAAP